MKKPAFKKIILCGVVLTLALFACARVQAERIILKSGKVIEGAIQEETPDTLTIDMDGITIPIPRDKIDRVEGREQPSLHEGPGVPQLVIQAGHSESVNRIAVSPDGSFIASSSDDNTIKIWDPEREELVHTIPAHDARVTCVSISPDGSLIASSSYDGKVKLWDTGTFENRAVIGNPAEDGYEEFTDFVVFSPGGKFLYSAGWRSEHQISTTGYSAIKTIDVETGEITRMIKDPSMRIASLSLSPDGRTIAVGGDNNIIRFWDAKTGLLVYTLGGHENHVSAMAYNRDGSVLASGDLNGEVIIWNPETMERQGKIKVTEGQLGAMVFSADGAMLYTGTWDGEIRAWDPETGKEAGPVVKQVGGWVKEITVSPDGNMLVSGANDTAVRIWNPETLEPISRFEGGAGAVTTISLSHDGGLLAWGEGDGKISIWNMETGLPVKVIKAHSWSVQEVMFSPDGRFIASSGKDHTICIWDTTTWELLHRINAESVEYMKLRFTRDGKNLISGSDQYGIRVWDVESGALAREIDNENKFLYSIGLDPEERLLAVGSDHSLVVVRELATGKHVRTMNGVARQARAVLFSPDGSLMAMGGLGERDRGTVEMWKAGTFERIFSADDHVGSVISMAFSPEGGSIASAGYDHKIRIRDTATGRVVNTLEGHTAIVSAIEYDPDGDVLISGSWDATIKIWNASTGEALLTLTSFEDDTWFTADTVGRFDCSGCARGDDESGKKYIRWRVGNMLYRPEQFFDDFFEPGVFMDVMRLGHVPEMQGLETLLSEVPPEVKITWPVSTQTKKDTAKVKVEVSDMGGGVENVRLLSQGRPISGIPRSVAPAEAEPETRVFEFEIPLAPGENRIVAVASSRTGVDSREAEFMLESTQEEPPPPRLFLLTVGINKYLNSMYDLQMAKPDADAIAEVFSSGTGDLFSEIKTYSLRDEAATADAMRGSLEEIMEAADINDMVVIYLAGHGTTAEGAWYFLTHEIKSADEHYVGMHAYSQRELKSFLKRLKARKVLLIIDACQSGAMTLAMARGLEKEKIMREFARSTGTYVLAASADTQSALELKDLGHGVFTYTLLEGLSGKADINNTGTVEVKELEIFAAGRVPEYTEKYYGRRQDPFIWGVAGGGGIGGMGPPLIVLDK